MSDTPSYQLKGKYFDQFKRVYPRINREDLLPDGPIYHELSYGVEILFREGPVI